MVFRVWVFGMGGIMIVKPYEADEWWGIQMKEYKVMKAYHRNGEGWFLMSDGNEYPDIFFQEVRNA